MEQIAALWDYFIKTGSPAAYMAYKAEMERQAQNQQEAGETKCT